MKSIHATILCLVILLGCSNDKSTSPESEDPTLALSVSELLFEAGEVLKAVVISNSGGGDLSWTAQENPEQSWLSIEPNSGVAGDQLNVTINPDSMQPGTSSGNIQIRSNGGNQNLPITALISNLSLSDSILAFTEDDTVKTVQIQNTGAGNLNWNISPTNIAWLSISQTSGENDLGVTFRVDTDLLSSSSENIDLTITSTGGTKVISVSVMLFPTSIFLDDFSDDLSEWNVANADGEIQNGLLELTGTSSTYVGKAEYEFDTNISAPWCFRTKYGRKNDEDGTAMMYMSIDDPGTIVVSALRFDIFSDSGDNWAAVAFIFNLSTFSGGWALLEENAIGYSSDINGDAGGLNDIAWAMTSDKEINIYLDGDLFYSTNILNELGMTISVGLESVEIWTNEDQTTWADWALVRDVDDPVNKRIAEMDGQPTIAQKVKLKEIASKQAAKLSIDALPTLSELYEQLRD